MARNGNGQYTLPAGNPVIGGTTITTDWANNTLNDIATALTGSVASDGQTAMQGNLDMSNNKIVGLTNGTAPQDAVTVNQLSNPAITGGTINGAPIGLTNPKDGNFLALSANTGDFSDGLTAPTVTPATDVSNKVATTAFVQSAIAAVSSGVTSFNGRSGVVTLQASDVDNALGYTPYNAGTSTVVTSENVLNYTVGKTGQGATGNWGISISGNAASANTANTVDSITSNQVTTALGYVPLTPNSPALLGTPTAPTAPVGTNTTQIATCAFVLANQGGGGGAVQSVNGKTGAVTLTASDVGAYPSNNPSGYTTLSAVQAQGYTTQAWVQSQGYVTSSTLNNYMTLNTTQTITGGKFFTGGISTIPGQAAGANGIWSGAYNFAAATSFYKSATSNEITCSVGASGVNAIMTWTDSAIITHKAMAPAGNTVGTSNADLGNTSARFSTIYLAFQPNVGSDQRDKRDIQEATYGLDFINALNPVKYKIETKKITDQTEDGEIFTESVLNPEWHYGFLAQEVKDVIGDGNNFAGWCIADPNDPLSAQSLAYGEFTAPMVKAIQQLSAKVDALQAELDALKK